MAVVDTDAEVTIICKQLFEKLSPYPNCLREIKICAADKDQTLTAKVVGPVKVEIGGQNFCGRSFEETECSHRCGQGRDHDTNTCYPSDLKQNLGSRINIHS